MTTSQRPRLAVVTGATDGIGRSLIDELAGRGWHVLAHGRHPARTESLRGVDGRQVTPVVADLANLASVVGLAHEVGRHPVEGGVVLINNAGVAGVQPRTVTGDGFELTFQVNYLAPVLLTELLLPWLTAAPSARVVHVTSMLHRGARISWEDLQLERDYTPREAYARSKLALIMHTAVLARSLDGRATSAVSVHPGVIDTKLLRGSFGGGGHSVRSGAAALAHAAAGDVIHGGYYEGLRRATPAPLRDDDVRRLHAATLEMLSAHLGGRWLAESSRCVRTSGGQRGRP